jgi:uncharacterized membrane protein YesL
MQAFKIIWKAAVAFYDEMFHFLLMGTVTLIGCILILPGPFVVAGLYATGQKAVRGEGIKWATYWQGMKEFGLRSWLVLIIVALGYVILYTNFWFYTSEISPFSEQVGFWLVPLWLGLGVIWTGVAYYAQGFLMELEKPKIIAIFRSSLFLTILHPLATLILVVVSLLVLALSVAFPVLLILSPSFLFVLVLTSIRTQITTLVEKNKENEEESEEGEQSNEEYQVDEVDEQSLPEATEE